MGKRYVFIFWCFCTAVTGCTQFSVFEKNTVIPGYKWKGSFTPSASLGISDTSSRYNIYVVLRHTDYYKYNNLWLDVSLQAPGDTVKHQKVELTFGNDAMGWEGTGIHDIWEVRKLVAQNQAFTKAGLYTFTFKQIMRDDPLPGIMNIGIKVEKTYR